MDGMHTILESIAEKKMHQTESSGCTSRVFVKGSDEVESALACMVCHTHILTGDPKYLRKFTTQMCFNQQGKGAVA